MSTTVELPERPDVLVVGGGVAGALAAARAHARGASVVLVGKAGGASSLSSGAIDVADDRTGLTPSLDASPFARGGTWAAAVEDVARRHARHPYARIGAAGRARMPEALTLLQALTSSVGLVQRHDGHNHVVVTQLGTVKRTALVQHSQALDVLALPAGARVAVVDFLDLGGFSAPPVVAMLAWIAELARADLHVVPVTVARTLSDMDIFGTCFEMAGALDDDNTRGRILHALNDALLAVGATHVLLPPVLGRARAAVVHADVHAALARPIAELLALPASAPGERLQHALHAALRERGVVVIDGGVDAAVVEQERVQSLQVRSGAQVQRVVPRAVVLASGRFLGGGLLRDQDARERVFGLPVVVDGVPLADRFIGDVLGDVVDSAHAVFRAGVAVDAQLRPVDVRGQVLLHNVFAAGSVIEGYDPARDGTAAGAAALTGLLAGEHAADEARRARSS